jgi:3-phenylpropionate/trans-cinnamate dioxygenase ferredoxin subunit
MGEFVAVAGEGDLGEGEMMAVQVQGRRVLLARVQGRVYAIGAVCTHEEGNLDEGDLDGFDAVCPIHFASFDVRTGRVTAGPADRPEPVYEVRVEGGRILVSRSPKGA